MATSVNRRQFVSDVIEPRMEQAAEVLAKGPRPQKPDRAEDPLAGPGRSDRRRPPGRAPAVASAKKGF